MFREDIYFKTAFCTFLLLAIFAFHIHSEVVRERCRICSGTGSVVCRTCGGKGSVRREGRNGAIQSRVCGNCHGNGRTNCSACGGNGWSYVEEKESENAHRVCTVCNGRGNVQCNQCLNSGWGIGKTGCNSCAGFGYKYTNILTGEKEVCAFCSGTGKRNWTNRLPFLQRNGIFWRVIHFRMELKINF